MRLEELVGQKYDTLNENDLRIWKYILRHKEACKKMAIQDLAAACNLSHTTILRFARKLGLEGYSELKLYLKWDDESTDGIGQNEITLCCEDIEQTMSYLRKRDCSDIFDLFEQSERIYAYGTGQVQKSAAEEMKKNFIFMNKQIVNLDGEAEMKIMLNYCGPRDLYFLLSHSGENPFILNIAEQLKKKGSRTISVTRVGNNSLSRICDISLFFYNHLVKTDNWDNELYMTSQYFLINEMLMLKYMEYLAKARQLKGS
ncbi:MurR/RpiR family transcriptional regulator [Clostridium sp. AM58-1XD]|uniref:MurR/RpiR family transcriptional regulator n=1 Tax=Clostridium sp. AM58-1XD TaxID=2292307 RepID=UPI000E48F899|nr:MurR/RpiR family transcriptional regulator [Clostridium sp. AM58-1XD]RGZ00979.1 MurR/RpiR family transcriptional regulator [Clostridium sp. AM58-1XD]